MDKILDKARGMTDAEFAAETAKFKGDPLVAALSEPDTTHTPPLPTKSQRMFDQLAIDHDWTPEQQGALALEYLRQDAVAMSRFAAFALERANADQVESVDIDALNQLGYRVDLGAAGYQWTHYGDAEWSSNYSYQTDVQAWRSAHVDAVGEGLVAG